MQNSSINSNSQTVVFPKELKLEKIILPAELGKIEETFQGKADEVVILIQDAHTIPEAQRNIQKLISHFQKEYGVGLVGLEGASSQADPQILKSFPDKEILKKVTDEYFEKGELTGTNAAAILNDGKSIYHGIEDWKLYEQALGFYLSAMEKEPALLEKLTSLEKDLSTKKERAYSKELLQIDNAFAVFQENHSDLISVLKVLAKVKRPQKGTELAILLEESERGGDTHTQAPIDIEVKKLAQRIESFLKSQPPSQENSKLLLSFNEKFQDFQTSRMTPHAFALFMKELMAGSKISIKISSALSGLMKDQKKMRDIEGTKFFRDFEQYVNAVKESLFKNEEEQKLDRETRKSYTTPKRGGLTVVSRLKDGRH